ncbi:MAG: DUF1987 domain-containing protein [Chlorobi bacterium]|nr:DUF1987 domain-containing protein [Chlorobiota bacterium]
MESLFIEATEATPKINLNSDTGIFLLAERSLPENAFEFYQPILKWLNEYAEEPKEETIVNFKLDYFTTSSAKQIIKIFLSLEELNNTSKVSINWYYKKEDVDMYAIGLKYSKLVNLNLQLKEF